MTTTTIPFHYPTAKHPGLIPVTTWPELERLRTEHHRLIGVLTAAEDRVYAVRAAWHSEQVAQQQAARDAVATGVSTAASAARSSAERQDDVDAAQRDVDAARHTLERFMTTLVTVTAERVAEWLRAADVRATGHNESATRRGG